MNRKERRAASKHNQAGGGAPGSAQIGPLFAEAVRHHQLGQGFEAEALCRQVLARDAGHAGSLHLLGVIASRCPSARSDQPDEDQQTPAR